ncbi:MAG: SemiSWEET transporter [Ahniella sp.]|nr:SemiSWEET transporter [Ahniella sp.]
MNVELLGYLAAALTTMAFVPQAIKTLRTRDTSGISLGMYVLFVAGVLAWFVYGLAIGSMPIIVANAVTAVLAGCVLFVKLRHP